MDIKFIAADTVNGVSVVAGQACSLSDAYAQTFIDKGTAILSTRIDETASAYPDLHKPGVAKPAAGSQTITIDPASGAGVSGIVRPDRPKTFKRASSQPIYSLSSQVPGKGAPTIFWWHVFPAYLYLANPLAKYYAYYSTDHDSSQGGIFLALADSPLGPWRQYVPAVSAGNPAVPGSIYIDNQGCATNKSTTGILSNAANQTETPCVFWDDSIGALRMTYQDGCSNYFAVAKKFGVTKSANGAQSTLSATSSDGLTWTKDDNFIIDIPDTSGGVYSLDVPGDGHTGYFLPFKFNGRMYAYHLYGGQNVPQHALSSRSATGEWTTDHRPLPYAMHLINSTPPRRIEWHSAFAFQDYRGGAMLCARLSNFVPYGTTAGVAPLDCTIGLFSLASDLRTPLEKAKIVWTPDLPWENKDLRSVNGFTDQDGTVYAFYVCRLADGVTYNVGALRYE